MIPNRLKISKRATDILKGLKGRTGVTPNILCRIALMLSLRDRYVPNPQNARLDGAEFTLPTMLGEHVVLYECLLRQVHGELSEREAIRVFAAHIDNGIDKLRRIKSVSDILSFI